MSTSEKVKVPFRHKRWLGLPAPIVVGILAVLMVAGAALAALMFNARATTEGNVVNAQVKWVDGWIAEDLSGVGSVAVWSNNPTGAVLQTGQGSLWGPDGDGVLRMVINEAFPQGSFHMCAKVAVPAEIDGQLRVTGIDLGNSAILTAELSGDYCDTVITEANTSGTLRGPGAPGGDVLVGGLAITDVPGQGYEGWSVFVISFNVSILPTAAPGAFPSDATALGLTVETLN